VLQVKTVLLVIKRLQDPKTILKWFLHSLISQHNRATNGNQTCRIACLYSCAQIVIPPITATASISTSHKPCISPITNLAYEPITSLSLHQSQAFCWVTEVLPHPSWVRIASGSCRVHRSKAFCITLSKLLCLLNVKGFLERRKENKSNE
jgi:hypothetical protein